MSISKEDREKIIKRILSVPSYPILSKGREAIIKNDLEKAIETLFEEIR